MALGNLLFQFSGRTSRGQYWLAWLIYIAIYLAFLALGYLTESVAVQTLTDMVVIVLVISAIAVGIKRLQDREHQAVPHVLEGPAGPAFRMLHHLDRVDRELPEEPVEIVTPELLRGGGEAFFQERFLVRAVGAEGFGVLRQFGEAPAAEVFGVGQRSPSSILEASPARSFRLSS